MGQFEIINSIKLIVNVLHICMLFDLHYSKPILKRHWITSEAQRCAFKEYNTILLLNKLNRFICFRWAHCIDLRDLTKRFFKWITSMLHKTALIIHRFLNCIYYFRRWLCIFLTVVSNHFDFRGNVKVFVKVLYYRSQWPWPLT